MKNIQPDAVDAIVDGRSNNADYVFNVEAGGADQICVHVQGRSRVAHSALDDMEQLLVACDRDQAEPQSIVDHANPPCFRFTAIVLSSRPVVLPLDQ